MALTNTIVTVWSGRLWTALKKSLVYAQAPIVNTDYEGEVVQAAKVKINSVGPITIGSYTRNTDMSAPEALSDDQVELEITEADYFNFQIDDLDRAQTRPTLVDGAMTEAAYGLADAADQFVAGLYTGAAAGNLIGSTATPATLSNAAAAYEKLVDLGVILDEANVPAAGRWAVVPSWFHGLMQKDDRFISASNSGSTRPLANGEIGEAAGFRLLKSNNVPNTTGTKYRIMAGHPRAISFANQLDKVEAYRPEKRFSDAMKGLHVYGAKVVDPDALAVLTVNRPS